MPQIKRVLFPVDFSASCLGAARYAEALAGQFQAEIILLHVVGAEEQNLTQDVLSSRQAQLDAFLADELKYFTTRRLCVIGNPSLEIVATARRSGADLVMMATHGYGVFRRFLLGSVTAKVLHDLDCPVWTSVHAEAAPPLEGIHCRKILCALDLNERSASILDWCAWLAGEYQARLGIVHATPELPAVYDEGNLNGDFERSVLAQAGRRIEMLQTACGAAEQVYISAGKPSEVVAQASRDFKADLVVIGRHGHTGVTGYLRHHSY
jgi:nucleotide-binding universal stress UspA family protein